MLANAPSNHVPPGRIGIVRARWHATIVDRGCAALVESLQSLGAARGQIDIVDAPGSLEIPLRVQKLCKTGRYAAIVAVGFVVDGGIYRHEFVAQAVLDGLMRVQLDHGVPVLSMVLTPQRFHDHDEHESFFRSHFKIKGAEAARACIDAMAAFDTPQTAPCF